MIKLDSEFSSAIEALVGRIEQDTDAEVVVVAKARSDPWNDARLRATLVVLAAVLCFVIWSPWLFDVHWLPLELVLIGGLTYWAIQPSTRLLHLLLSRGRIRSRVEEAAAAAFHTEAVHATRGRTGVLVFLSCLERQVVVLADSGVEARLPGGFLHTIRWGAHDDIHRVDDLASFLRGLEALAPILATHIPPLDDNPDELGNAPRIHT